MNSFFFLVCVSLTEDLCVGKTSVAFATKRESLITDNDQEPIQMRRSAGVNRFEAEIMQELTCQLKSSTKQHTYKQIHRSDVKSVRVCAWFSD